MHATAGSLIGIGEIVILPLDVLKIKRQTNPEAFRGRGLFRIIADEGFGLYRGWGWTAARNAPGSFAVGQTAMHSIHSLTFPTAVRWLCGCQGIPVQAERLQRCQLDAELRCLDRRCQRFPSRVRSARCHQDEDPEQEFRKPRERLPDRFQHDPPRGLHVVLQGTDAKASDDRPQARVLLLASSNAYTCIQQGNVSGSSPRDGVLYNSRVPGFWVVYKRFLI